MPTYLNGIRSTVGPDIDGGTIDGAVIGGTTPAAGAFTTLNATGDATFGAATRVTIKGAADQDGIVFGSLGTATKAIDLSSCGLSGGSDYWIYNTATSFWNSTAKLQTTEIASANGTAAKPGFHATSQFTGMFFPESGKSVGFSFSGTEKNRMLALASLWGNSVPVGSLTDCTSNATTTIAKSSTWGFTPATGDLLHVTDSSTAADEGFYRVVTVNLNTSIIVDRALTASQTDVDITIYKDVIGIFVTDGTNGQHLVGFSHQDKPLVIGGDRAGTGGGSVPASGNSAFGGEDVLIGNQLAIAAGTVDIPLTDAHTWDALATNIPAAAANDDLALVTGTTGTDAPSLQAGDIKTTDSERYAGFLVRLPMWYNPGSTVKIRLSAGMKTTIADTSCVLDLNVYTVDYANNDLTVSGDLCETAAQSMNSTTFANLDFTIDDDAAGYVLAPGSILQVKVIADYTDGSTGTAVIPTIRHMELIITR